MVDCEIRCITKPPSNGGHEHIIAARNPTLSSGGGNWLVQQVIPALRLRATRSLSLIR